MSYSYYTESITGPQGPAGNSVTILGSYDDLAAFEAGAGASPGAAIGDAWILLSDGSLQSWNGSVWFDAGDIKGPQGEQGEPGPATYGDIAQNVLPSEDRMYTVGNSDYNWLCVNTQQLNLVSGTVDGIAGSLEYDGRVFYGTPIAGQIGIIPSRQTYYSRSDIGLANNTSKQSILGLASGVEVTSGTRYAYTLRFRTHVTADSINLFFALEGTATYLSHQYTFDIARATYAGAFSPVTKGYITAEADNQVRSATHISYGEVGGTYWKVQIDGTVDINAGGYLKPVVLFSPTPGTAVAQDGGYMEIYPIGPSGVGTTSVGTWS